MSELPLNQLIEWRDDAQKSLKTARDRVWFRILEAHILELDELIAQKK